MSSLQLLSVGFFSLTLLGCGMFSNRPTPRSGAQPAPEVRDVPYGARGDGGVRQRILVLPFLNAKVGSQQEVLEVARKVVISDLNRSGRFVVIDPMDFPEDVKKYISVEGEYQLEEMAKKAIEMGISAIYEGKLLSIRAKRTGEPIGIVREIRAEVTSEVRVRMVAAINGREVLNEKRSASLESKSTRVLKRSYTDRALTDDPGLTRGSVIKAFRMSIPNVARTVEKLTWEGRIAMLQGERVFINAGRLSGIQIGDILKVTEEGKEIFDPETGRYIGMAPGRMKGTLEIVSYFGKDGSIGIVHSGSGFEENDKVEIY